MAEEKMFKKEGEALAKVAVDSGMGLKQLQVIYRLVKTKPMVFVQAFVQRQIGRNVRGLAAFQKVLEFYDKYEENKAAFEKVLMYAIMLYSYIEVESTVKLRVASESIVRNIVSRHGGFFSGLEVSLRGNSADFKVKTKRFHGPPKMLAVDIEKALKANIPEFANVNLNVWIEKVDRR